MTASSSDQKDFDEAARNGQMATLKALSSKMSPDDVTLALKSATIYEQRQAAQWLLDQGGDPRVDGSEALIFAAQHGWTELCVAMIQKGAQARENSSLAFRKACHRGHLATVQALAPHSRLDDNDNGALYWAASEDHGPTMAWLIEQNPEGIQMVLNGLLFEENWTTMDHLLFYAPKHIVEPWLKTLERRHPMPKTEHRLRSDARNKALQDQISPARHSRPRG